jgi:hypothetical protein
MKNIPHCDLDELTAEELIYVVHQIASDLLASGHTPEDLLECEFYRDLEQYADDRLRFLRNRGIR